MFWKVQLLKDGSISTVEPCETKGVNGASIIYVEAETKTQACARAKEWHAKKLANWRRNDADRRQKALTRGLCLSCRKRPRRSSRVSCQTCADQEAARKKRRRAAGPSLASPKDPLAQYERDKATRIARQKERGGSQAFVYRGVLTKFDQIGDPEEFRAWLISRIRTFDNRFVDPRAREYPQAAE